MTDFKVGDKVKTTVNVLGWEKELPKGTVTTVTEVEPFQMAQVRIPCTDSTGICHFKELALIEPKLEIGDKVRVLIGSPLNESKGTIATVGCINSGTLVTCRTSIPYNINWVYSLDEIERVDMLKVGDTFAWQYGTAYGNWENLDGVFIITGIDSNYLRYTIGSLDGERKIAKDSNGVSEESIFYRMKPEDWARIDWPETEDKVEEVVKEVVTEQKPEHKFKVGDKVRLTEYAYGESAGSIGKVLEIKGGHMPYKVGFRLDAMCQYIGSLWLTETLLEPIASNFTVGQRVVVEGFDSGYANEVKRNGTVGIVTGVDPIEDMVHIDCHNHHIMYFKAKFLRLAPGAEPVADPVEVCKKPKSLKKRVKAYHSNAKLCDSTKDSLLECFNSALHSLLDPNETSRGASEDIVRMIAYLTQLYTFYRGDAK